MPGHCIATFGQHRRFRQASASPAPFTCIKDLETAFIDLAAFSDFHDGRYISASIAVVWRTPDGDEVVLWRKHVLEAFLHELVRPGYEGYPVDVVELGAEQRGPASA